MTKKKVEEKKPSGRGPLVLSIVKPDDNLPRGYLSFSAMSTYLKCPRQFMYAYIENLKQPPGIAMIEGSAHHKILEHDNTKFLNEGVFESPEIMIEEFSDEFSDKSKEIPRKVWQSEKDSETDIITRGGAMITNYTSGIRNELVPLESESFFEVDIKGVPVAGYIDLNDKNLGVQDYKVTKAAKSQSDANTSLQLWIYRKAKKVNKSGFLCFTKTKNSNIKQTQTEDSFTKDDSSANVIKDVSDSIKKGSFPRCDPASWACTPKFCGYYRKCKSEK